MEALFAEMFVLVVLALVIQQSIKVLNPSIVKLTCHVIQQGEDPGHAHMLLTEFVNNHILVPSEDVDG